MSFVGLMEVKDLVKQPKDRGWGSEVIIPWFDQRPLLLGELHEAGWPDAHRRRYPNGTDGLYALSRLVDLLIAPHQPFAENRNGGVAWYGTLDASVYAWDEFIKFIGATEITEERFHPFFHEIVDVTAAEDPHEPASLVDVHWAGAMVGNMLLARSGVTVRAGSAVLDPLVASRSCMYWTWFRCNRAVDDLSHGWGSCSQWGTSFRRDHLVGDELHYNVDAQYRRTRCRLSESAKDCGFGDFSEQDRQDLVRFRHSTLHDFGCNLYPYNERFVEPRR